MNSFPCKIIEADLDKDIVTLQMEGVYTVSAGRKYLCDAAPVPSQPDLTQQTLDDVKAGIPARDAEIAALRKQVETLQAQLVDRSPEMQGTPVDESPNLQAQQQPVSGADELSAERVLIDGTAYELPSAVAAELLRLQLEILGSEQAQSSGNSVQLDHLPDATKMVGQDQGDSWSGWACQYPGKLPRLYGDKAIAELNHHPEEGDRLFQLAECIQQDADKVDAALAEMVHAMFRSGNSVPVTRITIDRKQYEATIDAARKERTL